MKPVKIFELAGVFAENKDAAAKVREQVIYPALRERASVTVDFSGVAGATQSFIHALIADPIRKLGSDVLKLLSFKGCNASIKGVVGIVVDYVQLGLDDDVSEPRGKSALAKNKSLRPPTSTRLARPGPASTGAKAKKQSKR